jgi:hypothetical protein
MKHFRIIFVCAIVAMVMAFTSQAQADQGKNETITVKSVDTNNGVVIVKATSETGGIELQCNKDFPNCSALKAGKYSMVRLPKDWGRYECANVEVYALASDPETRGEVLGAYCLMEH